MEGVVPIQKAIVCKAWACVDYLVQSLSPQPPSDLETPPLLSGEMFQRARNLQGMNTGAKQSSSTTSVKLKKARYRWFGDKNIDLHKARDPEVSSCTLQ